MTTKRTYRLGRREAAVVATRQAVLAAARELVSAGDQPSVGAVAARAGVSRITVYNQFGSKSGLLASLAPRHDHETASLEGSPRDQLNHHIQLCCEVWADAPALHRNLPHSAHQGGSEMARVLAERLAAADDLRPGCSIKEAEDVISVLTSFAVFDRLHKEGRRSPPAVAEIILRLASALLT